MANPIPESRPSTCRKARRKNNPLLTGLLALALFAPGCGPKYTYPAEKVPKSIEDISMKEYQLAVKARVVGRTVGALMYVNSLLDESGQIPKEVNERMGRVLQVVTRVALSTDLPLDYCMIVVRDRQHSYQMMVTRSLEDTKRAYADALGIEESLNRTLFGQDKYDPAKDTKATFVLEDIKQENFLTEQIVQRIRFSYMRDAKDEIEKALVMVDGTFDADDGRRVFRFSMIALRSEDPREMILNVFRIVNQVLQGYKYTAFDSVEIQDYLNRQKLTLDKQTLLDYQKKKISEEEIIDRYLSESQSVQEAFKLFGFTLPQSSEEKKAPVAKPAP